MGRHMFCCQCYVCMLPSRLGWHPVVDRIVNRFRWLGSLARSKRGVFRVIRRHGLYPETKRRTREESAMAYHNWRKARANRKTDGLRAWLAEAANRVIGAGDGLIPPDRFFSLLPVSEKSRSAVHALICAAWLRGVDPLVAASRAHHALRKIRHAAQCERKPVPVAVIWGDDSPAVREERHRFEGAGSWWGYRRSTTHVVVGFNWILSMIRDLVDADRNPRSLVRSKERLMRAVREICLSDLASW